MTMGPCGLGHIVPPCGFVGATLRTQWREPFMVLYTSVSQPPGRGINYTGPREVLLEFVILVF